MRDQLRAAAAGRRMLDAGGAEEESFRSAPIDPIVVTRLCEGLGRA